MPTPPINLFSVISKCSRCTLQSPPTAGDLYPLTELHAANRSFISSFCAGALRLYLLLLEKLGREKRDILVSRVKGSKKDQQQAKEQIKTTVESFQELTGFQGGSLEKSYKKLNDEYERSQAQANKLHDRINSTARSAATISFPNGRRKSIKWVRPS